MISFTFLLPLVHIETVHEFSLLLDKRFKSCVKELLKSNWLSVHDIYLQFIVSDIFKFHNDQCSDHFDELFFTVGKNSVNAFFQ